jgi:hypothetical protein
MIFGDELADSNALPIKVKYVDMFHKDVALS